MRKFLLFTLVFIVFSAFAYLRIPASEAWQWPNLILGYYIGAIAMHRFMVEDHR